MNLRILQFILTCFFFSSCGGQANTKNADDSASREETAKLDEQIGAYVVEIFEDSKANLWFGTLEKGVAKYDGKNLKYLTMKDGLPSNRVTTIIEDKSGILWFGTGSGISKYDGKTFINYSEKDGLCNDMVSNLFIDSKNTFWIGTWGGVCRFDGNQFEDFPIPYPKVKTRINPDTVDWITEITEDSKGNIWFGRDGYAACKYDGTSFRHLTVQAGLNSNNVQAILEDINGDIWIGTRVAEKDDPDPAKRLGSAGLNKYDGQKFVQFPSIKGLHNNDVYGMYVDNSNNLWFSTIQNGVYKYSDQGFVNYEVPTATMVFQEDRNGIVWLGCAGGLYNIDKEGQVKNVTTSGPWD